MNIKFRSPPQMKTPKSSRWNAVFRINPTTEIWFLDLRKAMPYVYYPIFCFLENDKPTARYSVPLTERELLADKRLVKGWGHRFFWSDAKLTLVVQTLETFEYSEHIATEQIFLSGEDFTVSQILKNEVVQLLPNTEFREVFPEMHPDR